MRLTVDKKYCKINNNQLESGKLLIKPRGITCLWDVKYMFEIYEIGKDELKDYIKQWNIGTLEIGQVEMRVISVFDTDLYTTSVYNGLEIINKIKESIPSEGILEDNLRITK